MKRIITTIILVIFAALTFGCAAILEDERVEERRHVIIPVERPPYEQIEVSDFYELKEAIIELIMAHETSARIVSFSYDTEEVQYDLDRAINEIMTYHPIGVYAVSEIIGHATKIVTFFEITLSIEYMRTMQQIDSIFDVSESRDLRQALLEMMGEYSAEAVFRTPLQLTVEDIVGYIVDIYYQNPRRIFWRPVVAVEVFPESGEDRIFSVRFDFGRDPGILRALGDSVFVAVRSNVEAAEGDTEARLLLSLANNLIAIADFDEFAARTLPEHGLQNPAATAFGALINGSAIGEGFAMAFKALSDELGISSRVVLGTLDGQYHAWNLVNLDGHYYHIDVAKGDVNGIENTFLLSDTQMRGSGYVWDFENTPRAVGVLTFEDIVYYEDGEPYENPPESEAPQTPGNNVTGTTVRPGTEPEMPDEPESPEMPDTPEGYDEPDESGEPETPDESEETDEQSET